MQPTIFAVLAAHTAQQNPSTRDSNCAEADIELSLL
jgi:hypothetical protein